MKILIFLIIIFFSNNLVAQILFTKSPEVRIRIINNLEKINLIFNDEWNVKSLDKNINIEKKDNTYNLLIVNDEIQLTDNNNFNIYDKEKIVLTPINNKSTLNIKKVPYGIGWAWQGTEERIYEGEITIYKDEDKKLLIVVKLPLEEYLKGVVPYEIGVDSPFEALKAQAVAARSEAIIALTSNLYSGVGYDLTSDVECQGFRGNKKRTELTDSAVIETQSLILTEKGIPINAYYSSNCGGFSENISNVWSDRIRFESYSLGKVDNINTSKIILNSENDVIDWIENSPEVNCNPSISLELPKWTHANFRWELTFSVDSLTKMLSKNNDFGLLKNIIPLKRGDSGRIYSAEFIFEKKSFIVEGELNIRKLFTPALKSSCFYIINNNYDFTIKGAGYGHGVGMCQTGAISLAQKGEHYINILKHYYPKADILSIFNNN